MTSPRAELLALLNRRLLARSGSPDDKDAIRQAIDWIGRNGRPRNLERDQRIRELLAAGRTITEVAEAVGVSPRTVAEISRRL